ncbi:MAG: glycosyltransferase family 4 protein [Thermoplasmata archaeon]|nr:MAG: glycosyltransferase family 4 protein [Thermoplasmata archaeon]
MIPVITLRYHPALGGVETRALEVTSRLAESFDLRVVTSDLKMERPFKKLSQKERITEYKGVPIVRLKAKRLLPVEGYGVRLKGLEEALSGSEMIHCHTYGAYQTDKAVKFAQKKGTPSLLTTHLHPSTHSHHKMLRSLYDGLLGKKTFQRCTHIITITEIERDYIFKRFGISKEKMTAIPNGIDLDKFRDLGYEREETTLLFVGRLSPVKRLDMLLEALARVKKTKPEIKLKIIGRDWGVKGQLVKLAQNLKIQDNIEFLEEIPFDELIEHYNRAKLFVLTSRYEAFGITIMEAIGCGTPVVVTSVGGIPEVVGNSGVLCRENPKEVAESIIDVLTHEDRYNSLKERTRERRKLFDWNIIAGNVKQVYEETLEKA